MMDYSFFTRMSDGGLKIASYHPKGCRTWHWSVSVVRSGTFRKFWLVDRTEPAFRRNQWHDYYRLPFGRALCISRQDYHLQAKS